MKKLFAGMMALVLCFTAMPLSATAEGEQINVKVTLSDKDGNTVLQQKPVTVTDIDGDGTLTINDALYIAHEENFAGGASAGYEATRTEYGYGITKLWGTANGGAYGYYVNHVASNGVDDVLKEGDYLDAYVYTDTKSYSDKYTFFDKYDAEILQGGKLSLTLRYAGYDENWNPVTLPVEGAVITVNGEEIGYFTNSNGRVEIPFYEAGEVIVSANCSRMTIVKPVLPVTVYGTGTVTLMGDVDVDGDVDIVDVLRLNQYLLSLTKLKPEGLEHADSDMNGFINDADAMNILKAIVGLYDLPIIPNESDEPTE